MNELISQREQEVILWAQFMQSRPFVVFDCETSGTGAAAEILQVAVIDPCGEVLLSSLVKPVHAIDESGKAFAVNGISNAMVAHAPTFPALYPRLRHLLQAQTVVIYNAEFDTDMLEWACIRTRLPSIEADWHCAMKQFAKYVGDVTNRTDRTNRTAESHRSDMSPMSHSPSYRWHKLRDACVRMGVETKGLHEGVADCLATLALVRVLAGLGENHDTGV